MNIEVTCFQCGTKLEFQDTIPRTSECNKCRSDVRCCKNCEFYDPKVYNDCRETQADPIRERDRANFCGFFKVKSPSGGGSAVSSKEAARLAAEALFKKK